MSFEFMLFEKGESDRLVDLFDDYEECDFSECDPEVELIKGK